MLIVTNIREYINIVESAHPVYYGHVSPAKNLKAILRRGLQPNLGGGNYSGYETSLRGVYVSRVPALLKTHLAARQMEDRFVLVIVVVNGLAHIDEDVLDVLMHNSVDEVLASHQIPRQSIEDLEPDDAMWDEVERAFLNKLGQPNQAILAQHPDLVREFCESYVTEHLYGEDIDSIYWEDAKETIIQCFPAVQHPLHGTDYSLRIPHAITYTGNTHIVAVIEMLEGEPHVLKGALPNEARSLVQQLR